MAKQLPYSAWDFTDLQSRYERAQSLANDCVQDFAGNYFFPSDRSPRGFWTTTRKQRLDYVCDCPDFSRVIDQQITSSAPSRWVRGDWSTNPDNTILVNRCIHCLAVAIAERELDPRFPVSRIYQAKRSRFPKSDCGCGCGGSGSCGCSGRELGLPEPKLILGCETECYVEPLTSRTVPTVPTNEGIPAYQSFEIPTIEFAETKYRGCAGGEVSISLRRSTALGYNNATVVGLPVDVEFPFEPEFRTSTKLVSLDNLVAGTYQIAIGAIASGNFGRDLNAEIEVIDCGLNNDDDSLDCPEQEFVDFDEGTCEGSYYIAFRQTGNKNPDGTCEQIKVFKFEEGLDCPFPEDPPPQECESLIPRDCDRTELGAPKCVQTGSGDGFNANAGFNAVVRIQTGNKEIEYLRPDKKECAEYCEIAELAVFVPSCPEPSPKPIPAPFCPLPVKRYLGWKTEAEYLASAAVNGIGIHETFSCDDGTAYVLVGRLAKCLPPANRYVDSFEAATYDGNKFGEGCCPFDETKPERPVCPVKPEPVTRWSCSGGICSPDPNGTYNSQAECEAALIPPSFTGGQCPNVAYRVWMVWDGIMCPSGEAGLVYGQTEAGQMTFNTPPTDAFIRANGVRIVGTQQSVRFVSYFVPGSFGFAIWVIRYLDVNNVFQELQFTSGVNAAEVSFCLGGFQVFGQSARIFKVLREDGLPDTCGNPPPTCP